MRRVLSYIKLLRRLNITKTLYFNFKVFPSKIAFKLPVFIFGRIKFASLSGKILIKSSVITRGMIVFGSNAENIIISNDPTRLFITGDLVFEGRCTFMQAAQIVVWDNGILKIGNNASFGTHARIVTFKSVTILENLLASWECQIFDTDFHFLRNVQKDIIYNNCKAVHIGKNVWIGNRATILKGTFVPDYCIIAGNSICNKDYSLTCPEYSAIGGVPAKLIKSDVTFISDKSTEKKLNRFFWNHQDSESIGGSLLNSIL